MTREDMEFDVTYSFYVEKMNYRLLTRIDKFITLILIVLGFSVFAPFSNLLVFGIFVAILSVLQLVYQFGPEAGISKEQMRQYKRLLIELPSIKSDDELRERYLRIQDADSTPWQSLENAAYKRACIVLNRIDDSSLSFKESLLAWLAGDLPTAR